jgi:polyisoprenoid-binding protein YceI
LSEGNYPDCSLNQTLTEETAMTQPATLTATELHTLLRDGGAPVLIDVLTEEAFTERHIAQAQNFCVYETAFLDKVAGAIPSKETTIVVYGEGTHGEAAHRAWERLTGAGYTKVHILDGGFAAWAEAGLPAHSGKAAPGLADVSGQFAADTERSVIYWTGRNLFNHHTGTIGLCGGSVSLEAGRLTGADFVVDFETATSTDLKDASLIAGLIGHLKSSDFFDVANHPEIRFVLTKATQIPDATDGRANTRVEGDFTLRGQTHPLAFDALIAVDGKGDLYAQAEFDLDRTIWGANYGSGRIFERLGMHVVNDLVHLHLKLVARAA